MDLYRNELDCLESELLEITEEGEEKQIEICDKTVRTMLTKGVAGIGKTFQTRKFMVDWAEGKSNKTLTS